MNLTFRTAAAWAPPLLAVLLSAQLTAADTATLIVTRNPIGGGSTTPDGTHPGQPTGTPIPISATAAPPYLFDRWEVSPAGAATVTDAASTSTTVTLTGDATCSAVYSTGLFLNTDTAPSGGSVQVWYGRSAPATGSPVLVPPGTDVSVKAVARSANQRFSRWTLETALGSAAIADPTAAQTTVRVAADGAKIMARFDTTYRIALDDQTRLPSGTAIWLVGFSTASGKLLAVDGSGIGTFAAFPAASGTMSAVRLGDEITAIDIDTANPIDGARIYCFIADAGAARPQLPWYQEANPVTHLTEWKVTQPAPMPQTAMPPYNYVELTFLGSGLFIDVSTVDGLYFPMSITSRVGTANRVTVGQPLGSGTTLKAITDVYGTFMQDLAANGEPAAGSYLALRQVAATVAGTGYEVLVNPGAHLIAPANAASPLHGVFDAQLNELFTTRAGSLRLWQNADSTFPNGHFTASASAAATVFSTTNTHAALVLTAPERPGKSYVIYNPVGFSVVNAPAGDGSYFVLSGAIAGGVLTFDRPLPEGLLSVGMYLDGGPGSVDGTTRITAVTPATGSITAVSLSGSSDSSERARRRFSKAPLHFYQSTGTMVFACMGLLGSDLGYTDDAVDGRIIKGLQNQIATALNRGVAHLDGDGSSGTTDAWATQSNWYPHGKAQNLFSYFTHVATAGGTPIFTRPSPSATSARGTTMGMAYGFAYDEDSLHSLDSRPVPAELTPTMLADADNLVITFGAWRTSLGSTGGGSGGGSASAALLASQGLAQSQAFAAQQAMAAGDGSSGAACGLGSGLALLLAGLCGLALRSKRRGPPPGPAAPATSDEARSAGRDRR